MMQKHYNRAAYPLQPRSVFVPTVTPLIDATTIAARIGVLAGVIGRAYADRPLTLLCCLKGGYLFTADLSRALPIPHRVAFVRAASYGDGTVSSGNVRFDCLDPAELDGRDVLLVEDIIDTGRTAAVLMKTIASLPVRSVRLCALLDKPGRREVAVIPDYLGFSIDDHFVVGYGLDYAEAYRNLPYIGVLVQDDPAT
ncbi:MAG: hypoxanthine phosphoribosyltransferase [Nitrospinae bacterium]|nr:hypoxanthine phosphoribosyltransferase [Nitrospinota bacterium]